MPTLYHSSMSAHRILVDSKDENSYTFKMNPLVCNLYNADFDGDAMQIIFATSIMS